MIGLWICLCLRVRQFWINEISKIDHEETQENGNKHVLFVFGNSYLKIFDFGWQIIKWVACRMNLIFMITWIFRQSEIRHFSIFHFCFVIAIYDCTPRHPRLIESNFHNLIIRWEGHSFLLTCSLAKFSFNNCSYFAVILRRVYISLKIWQDNWTI